jgi:malonate transporter and related proteins
VVEPVTGVLQGFVVILTMIAVGFVTQHFRLLADNGVQVLTRLVFFVMTPCLLLTVLVDADASVLLSSLLVVSLIAALACMALYAIVARFLWHRPAPELIIGSLSAGFANSGNIGIPVSLYVLGSAAYTAPVILLQMAVFTPIALAILDVVVAGRGKSWRRSLVEPVKNPIMIASVVGLLISLLRLHVPTVVMEPFRLIGNASVPLVLIVFGMSIAGQRPLAAGTARRDALVAVIIKIVVMPVIAWTLGRFAFGLSGHDLLVVTVLGALPTAQNVFAFASRYQRGESIARDAGLIATAGSIPVLLLVTALLR